MRYPPLDTSTIHRSIHIPPLETVLIHKVHQLQSTSQRSSILSHGQLQVGIVDEEFHQGLPVRLIARADTFEEGPD